MKPRYLFKHLRVMLLALATLLPGFAAWADLPYADKPLFYATGVQPNVALLIDNSRSMDTNRDAESSYPFVSTCTGSTVTGTGQITRMEAAQQAACQVVQDNANGMRIALYRFNGDAAGTGFRVQNFGANIPTLKSAIDALNPDQYTPLGSSMNFILSDYVDTDSPIQYRCQKNYIVFFTDGEPTAGIDADDSTPDYPTYPATSTTQTSDWPNSTSQAGSASSSPGWDGYTDPTYPGGTGPGGVETVRPWLDDLAQFGYDVDMKTASSAATLATVCGGTASLAGEDCTGRSWDDSEFPQQNVVTYTVGLGAEANNLLLRNTPLVNRHTVVPADVNTTANTITWAGHGLTDGQYAHYYSALVNQNYSTTATANTGSDTLTGNTLNMATGDALTYDNGGGANLQYQALTTPAVPGATCGAIGGLTSGTSYYVDGDTADRFYLATTSANAYNNTEINLTGAGTAGTLHSFTRTHATAGFTTTNSGTSPVNTGANTEKITRTNHGLNTGDFVTYTCTGGGCAIGGLTSGNSYYVARRSADEFRLATSALLAASCAAANDGNATVGTSCINLTGRGSNGGVQMFAKTATATAVSFTADGSSPTPVDTGNERIESTAHGFNVGDRVTYTCTNVAGTPAVYTSTNLPATVYARNVVAGNPGSFQISLTSGGAAMDLGASAGTAAQSFDWTKPVAQPTIGGLHAYVTDAIPDATPTPATEDEAKGKYYVKVVDGDTIQLYDAIRYGRSPFEVFRATFSGTNASTTSTNRKITLAHDFLTGDAVVYTCPNGCTGGLTNNTTYYVGVVNNTEIRLATTLANAAGCATDTTGCISFTSTDTDLQYLTHTPSAGAAVDITSTGSGVLSTGPGKSYFATTAAELSDALTSAFVEIRALELSFGTLGTNTSTEFSTATRLYQARFNTSDWSGDVRAYQITATGAVNPNPAWEASNNLPAAASRNILTRNGTAGAFDFTTANYGSLTAVQQNSLKNITGSTAGTAATGQNVLNWVRGEDVAGYRTRNNGKLGDMLNSGLTYVGIPNSGYQVSLPDSDPGKASYNAFMSNSRIPMVYGGSNGGMLHGFDASTDPTQGVEKVAFIPEAVYMDWVDLDNDGFKDAGETAINKFFDLARDYYGLIAGQDHHYFVNATPKTGDAYFSTAQAGLGTNQWHTVLVSGLGKGGRSVFALDITNDTFNAADVLWEFNDSNSGDMGYSYGEPSIERLSDGQWVAIFGNGYDSRNDQARMYIVNLETGALIQEIVLGAAGNNGVASITVLRSNTTTDKVTALTAYAGDLQGNVWKVDISNAASLPTSVMTPFFIAEDSGGNRQAITSAITLGRYPSIQASGVMLFFGTGSYFTDNDLAYNGTPLYDAMYGIWDEGATGPATVALTDLVEQQMGSVSRDFDGDGTFEDYRTATSNPVTYTGASPDRGWFMKMAVTTPAADYKGERVVFAPVKTTLGSFVLFTTVTPADADPCVGGGSSQSYAVDALSGGAKPYAIFDFDDDGDFGNDESGIVGFEADGLASGVVVFEDADGNVTSLTNDEDLDPNRLNTGEEDDPVVPGSYSGGRMSWRQLQ